MVCALAVTAHSISLSAEFLSPKIVQGFLELTFGRMSFVDWSLI